MTTMQTGVAVRPYMRLSTAEIAALLAGPAVDLAGIAAELSHRARPCLRARIGQPEPMVAKPVRKAASPRKRKGPETLAALQTRHEAMRTPGYWASLATQVAARRRELGALVQPWDGAASRRMRVRRLLDAMRQRGQHATAQTVGSHGEAGSVDTGPQQFRGRLATLRAIYNAELVGA